LNSVNIAQRTGAAMGVLICADAARHLRVHCRASFAYVQKIPKVRPTGGVAESALNTVEVVAEEDTR